MHIRTKARGGGGHPLLPVLGTARCLFGEALFHVTICLFVCLFIYLVCSHDAFVCVCVCMCIGVCAYVCVCDSAHTYLHMWRPEVDLGYQSVFTVFVLRQRLSLNLELTEWPYRLASKPWELPTATPGHTHLFKQCLGSKLRSSCLHSQHFTHRTVSPALT